MTCTTDEFHLFRFPRLATVEWRRSYSTTASRRRIKIYNKSTVKTLVHRISQSKDKKIYRRVNEFARNKYNIKSFNA